MARARARVVFILVYGIIQTNRRGEKPGFGLPPQGRQATNCYHVLIFDVCGLGLFHATAHELASSGLLEIPDFCAFLTAYSIAKETTE